MEGAKVQNGLVGLFDILGYQSFLENNDAEAATSEVVSVISTVGESVSNYLLNLEDIEDEEVKEQVSNIQWLVFSDTILMVLECESSDIDAGLTFLGTAGTLCHHMFDFGLPLRGAVTHGKYLISKSCFAGSAIVEAYRMGINLDLAACVVNEVVLAKLSEVAGQHDLTSLLDKLVIRYMTPLKGGIFNKIPLINFLYCESPSSNEINPNIEQMVLNSFWAHNKDMTSSAEVKARNTISFFRFLNHKMPSMF